MKYIYLILLLYSYTTYANDLELPSCAQTKALVTPITFFVPENLKNELSKEEVKEAVKHMLLKSNEILANSCIPIHRELREIVYAPELDTGIIQDMFAAENLISYHYDKRVSAIKSSVSEFYGLIVSTRHTTFDLEYCGTTYPSTYNKFFVVDITCDPSTLEHELGHLAWANHDIDTLSENNVVLDHLEEHFPYFVLNAIKPYSFGYKCGGKGTIMSYSDDYLPIYSAPEVKYKGIRCGNEKYANNARVLREYAESKIELLRKANNDKTDHLK